MEDITKYRNTLERLKGKREELNNQIKSTKKNIVNLKKDSENISIAQAVLQKVAKQTQDEITYHLSNIVTLALNSIFDEDYEFKLEFVERRGKTEAEMSIIKNGIKMDPMSSNGGGVVDVISFALRIAIWNIVHNRNTIIMDEPMKFLSRELQVKAGEMLKTLSEKLKLQFIIVSHDKALIDVADKNFNIVLNNKISEVVDG